MLLIFFEMKQGSCAGVGAKYFSPLQRWMPCGVTTAQGRKIFRPYAGTVSCDAGGAQRHG
jgi:hypothetical protein